MAQTPSNRNAPKFFPAGGFNAFPSPKAVEEDDNEVPMPHKPRARCGENPGDYDTLMP